MFYPVKNSESFNYKNKLIGNLAVDNNAELRDTKLIVTLKRMSNFIFNLDFLMINTEIELILKWSKNCVLTEMATRKRRAEIPAQGGNSRVLALVEINRPSDLKFNISDCKLYVHVVTLQQKYEKKLPKNLKTGIEIDYEWKRYSTQIINKPSTNNLNFLTDATFNNINGLFVLAFPNEEDRRCFSKYCTPTVKITF